MKINKDIFEKIMGSIVEDDQEIKISMFVASKKNSGLKKLNLDKLSPEQRAAKLHQWAQDHRFVAVIEMGDRVFAHVHAKYAEQLGNQKDLSVDDKKVLIKALTDEEADKLSLVGETFEAYVLSESEEATIQEEKEEKEETKEAAFAPRVARQYLAMNLLISDKMQMEHLIARMGNIPDQVILNCLRQIAEARREQEKQKEADDKYFRIKDREIQKSIVRSEITKEEVRGQTKKNTIAKEDSQRLNRTRGA